MTGANDEGRTQGRLAGRLQQGIARFEVRVSNWREFVRSGYEVFRAPSPDAQFSTITHQLDERLAGTRDELRGANDGLRMTKGGS